MAKTSAKKNFLYQVAYEVLIILLPLVTSPYISRVLGADNLGAYSYTYAVANYFVLFAMLGIKNYGNRAIARARDDQDRLNRTFSSIFFLDAMITALVIAAYAVYVLFIVREDQRIAQIQAIYVVACMFDINWFFFGMEKFKLTVTRNTLIKFATVCCVFLFVHSRDDLWKYTLIMAAGNFVSQSVVWLMLPRYVRFVRPTWKEMRAHIKPMCVLFIPVLAVSVYNIMDKIMLRQMSTKAMVAYYNNSERMVMILRTIIASFGTVMLPKMSNLAVGGLKAKKNSERYIRLSMQFVLFIAAALAFGLAGIAEVFAPIFWGDDFSYCSRLIQGLSLYLPFYAYANVLRTQFLIPNMRDKEYVSSVVAGAVLNFVFNLIFIPYLQAMGAVVGTIIAEIAVCLVQVWAVRRDLPHGQYVKQGLPFIGIGLLMYLVVLAIGFGMGNHIVTLLAQVAVGGAIYLSLSAVYFYRTKNELFLGALGKARRLLGH